MSGTIQKQALPAAFILSVTITIRTRDVNTFYEHFRPIFRTVVAEPECSYFIVGSTHPPAAPASEKDEELTMIHWTEGWAKDLRWLMDVQVKKPYYAPYFEATEKLFVKPRVVEVFHPVDGMSEFKV